MVQENLTVEGNKIDKVMEYIMNTPENTNPAVLKSLVKELLTVKKLKDISVRELLSIEDGFYKLEKPIEYIVDGGGETKPLLSSTFAIEHGDTPATMNCEGTGSDNPNNFMPQDGTTYHVKLEFETGVVYESDIEAASNPNMGGAIAFDLINIIPGATDLCAIGFFETNRFFINMTTTSPMYENKEFFGNSLTLTITEQDDGKVKPDGEIFGVINISTDTKILDGVTKVITSLADDTSYYVDNIWQDGDVLEVSAMDEGTEGGGGSGDFSTAQVTLINPPLLGYAIPICRESPLQGSVATPNPGVDTNTAILYKGHCYIGNNAQIESVTGNIQYIEKHSVYDITGDCTITFQESN